MLGTVEGHKAAESLRIMVGKNREKRQVMVKPSDTEWEGRLETMEFTAKENTHKREGGGGGNKESERREGRNRGESFRSDKEEYWGEEGESNVGDTFKGRLGEGERPAEGGVLRPLVRQTPAGRRGQGAGGAAVLAPGRRVA